MIHEWGHELLHGQRMTIEDALARIPKPVRELQVESVACIVGRCLGIDDPFKSAANYILTCGDAAETLIANMELVQRASAEMIERIRDVVKRRSWCLPLAAIAGYV